MIKDSSYYQSSEVLEKCIDDDGGLFWASRLGAAQPSTLPPSWKKGLLRFTLLST